MGWQWEKEYSDILFHSYTLFQADKRQKDQAKKQKITENRKHLANVRVVQKNLVFVVGLSPRLADPEILKKPDYFGKFGKIHKVVINHSTQYAGSQLQVTKTKQWSSELCETFIFSNSSCWFGESRMSR